MPTGHQQQLAAEDLLGPDGSSLGSGQLLADAGCHAVRADRSVHPRRFLLGPSVSGSAGSAGFARPGFNGPGFRQNDKVARELLQLAASAGGIPVSGPASSGKGTGTPARDHQPRSDRPGAPAHPLVHASPTAHPGPDRTTYTLHRMESSHAR